MRLRTVLHRRFRDDAGTEFVYLANSAAILALDEPTAAVVDAFAGGDADGVDSDAWLADQDRRAQAEETLHDLIDLGAIRPVDEGPAPRAQLPPMPFPLATLVLNVTNKCNLSCTYCYEYGEDKIGEGQGQNGKARMDDRTARDSIDFLMRSSGARPQVSITFFGGETLLNFDAIRAATEYAEQQAAAHQKRVHYSLTTNATLLTDEIVDFLTRHRFGITVSIDGDRDEQDRHRTYRSGAGSFDVVEPRIRALLAKNRERNGRAVGARVTVTAGATPVVETYRYLVDDLGFDEVGFAPVTAALGREYALGEQGYQRLLAEFDVLADEYVDAALAGRSHGFSNLGDLVRELHQGVNKAHPCGAGLGLLGVSTEGELGLCHRFVESDSHAVGNVRDGVDEGTRTAFLERAHVDNKTDCSQCFARPLCAGGCYHEAHVRYGDATRANVHYCEWIRGFVDLGLRAYGRIQAGNPNFLTRFDQS